MDILDEIKSRLIGRPTQDDMEDMAQRFWIDLYQCAYGEDARPSEKPDRINEVMALLKYNSYLSRMAETTVNDYLLMDKAQKPLELAKQLEKILKGLRDDQRGLKNSMDKFLADD